MTHASELSPELARRVSQFARALLAAARNWTLYPPEHSAVEQSIDRLVEAIRAASQDTTLSVGITPDTLLVDGAAADRAHGAVGEAASLLHDHDLLRITLVGEVPSQAVRSLLKLLAIGATARRDRGGPARIWAADGHASIILEQVDYQRVRERERGEMPEGAQRDDLWRSYNEEPFVADTYRTALDGLGIRADRLAQDLPAELPEWMETLGQENIRSLSVGLLIDLLALEKDPAPASDIARDMEVLAEDLLLAGAYRDANTVVEALAARARNRKAPGAEGCRLALDQLGDSPAMHETAALIGNVDEQTWSTIVNGTRLPKSNASLVGFVRGLRDRQIEKITIARGMTLAELRRFVTELGDRSSPVPVADRIAMRVGSHVVVGRIVLQETAAGHTGIAAARQSYSTAVETAETLWAAAKAGDQPDPGAARKIIDSLARLVTGDRTSLVALTALEKYDNYTFTHMVNVSVLTMAQARALNVEGPLLREFGLAALMHDIGKVNTPVEVLNKPDKLTKEEFDIMKQHVVDGAHILRRTPEMPALAPIVAFEHHLKQDLSGYPEHVGSRTLNLCTMIVSIADVFDALRSNRPYRQGLATSRIRAIMGEQGNPAFNQVLLKRFVNLMGLFPIGTLVRLITDELAVVTAEHPSDPFRPQVKVIASASGEMLEVPLLVSTWEHDGRGEHPRSVMEALDPEQLGLDPLGYL